MIFVKTLKYTQAPLYFYPIIYFRSFGLNFAIKATSNIGNACLEAVRIYQLAR